MLSRIYHLLLNSMASIAAFFILLVTLGISADVILRYTYGKPIVWMFDISQYALLYIPCMGMAWLAREHGHIAITTFVELAPIKLRQILGYLTTLLCAFSCSVIAYWGWIVLENKIARNSIAVQAIQVPEAWIYWVIPVGFSLTAVEFIRQLITREPYNVPSSDAVEVEP